MADSTARNDDPFRLNLEQQKKRAKELLRGLRDQDGAAWQRFRACHPRADLGAPALADAQLVVARELGLPSWPKLKSHIESMQREALAITTASPAPDEGLKTLHIRCGTDIRAGLRNAGFKGTFAEYSNPFCQGPVTHDPDLITVRASFLAAAYGGGNELSPEQAASKLTAEEQVLSDAAGDFDRVVLWMEHDSYDQLILVRCLARLAEAGLPTRLELISANQFPGKIRFLGLGQLPEEALRLVWHERQPVTSRQIDLARSAWDALASTDPRGLLEIGRQTDCPLPDLPRALLRHLRELPALTNGLSLTQHLVLEMLAEGSKTIGRLFHHLTMEHEPLPWLGDLMFFHVIEEMMRVEEPVFSISDTDLPFPKRTLTITDLGRRVLVGDGDWMSLGPPERWIGGVHIEPGGRCWRWDEENRRTVLA